MQVEKWLMSLLVVMRATVRARMTDAVVAYEDRPRDQWVGEYPAQVSYYSHLEHFMGMVNLN